MQQHMGAPLKKERTGRRPLSCGSHIADSCEECPRGNAESWCNGNYEWSFEANTCIQGS